MCTAKGLRVGCGGFPLSFAHYAEIFPVVEVQHTFYQPLLAKTLEKWRNQAAPEFEFTLKAWQMVRGRQPRYVLYNNISVLEDARRSRNLVSKT